MGIHFLNTITGILFMLLCCFSHLTQAANILAFFPIPTKSHVLIHGEVAHTLAEAGHRVTVLATIPNPLKNTKYNYIYIDIPALYDENMASSMVNDGESAYKGFLKIIGNSWKTTNETLNHPTMKRFLDTHKAGDFDLMIFGYFVNEFGLGLVNHFRCPIVISFMVRSVYALDRMVGNPLEMSYVPTLFSAIQQPMDFKQRVVNFLANVFELNLLRPWFDAKIQEFYDYNFPADRYPPLEEVYKNVSLILTNHHFSQGPIRPNVPALIEIGGIQIKEQPDPLPAELAKILDNAKEGVIYFSFGSNVQGSHLSKEKAKIMFDVLSKLPHTVLMKWGDSHFPGQAPNIIYKSWLPQDDILAHPNVKLFITHGGQGSVVESQYHGVPMVGIPFFGDQPANMAAVEKAGFGLALQYTQLTEVDFRNTILEVLNNPQYRENVQRFSKLYRDRPMTPRQMVRFWVDYVIRHKGAYHMQSPAVHMTWWQLHSLDVIAFLMAVTFGVFGLLVGLCRCLCCRGGKKATAKTVNKSKKNK
uniref:UDP-glycosyltransferases domain-containing protein n=1 Tax=Stomoxys calcitrans TaxID=35570 RepID=A0A1I8QEC1_STOCA